MYEYRIKEWLEKKYIDEKLSQNQIAKLIGCSQATIYKWMKIHNIEPRTLSESQSGNNNGSWIDSPYKDYAVLYREYIKNNKSIRDISKESNISLRTISRWLNNFDIKKDKNIYNKKPTGSDNKQWQGGKYDKCLLCGRTKLRTSIKCSYCYTKSLIGSNHPGYRGVNNITDTLRYASKKIRNDVLDRDNHKCRFCGSSDNLEMHHIIPFSVIRDNIIMEYKISDDIPNEAKTDKRLYDIDNCVTLCKECHINEHKYIKSLKDTSIYVYYMTILDVHDGDTITTEVDLGFDLTKKIKLRLYGINTNELYSKNKELKKLAFDAKKVMSDICVIGRTIQVKTYKQGKYGRWLGLLMLDDITYINRYLLDSGLAKKYNP